MRFSFLFISFIVIISVMILEARFIRKKFHRPRKHRIIQRKLDDSEEEIPRVKIKVFRGPDEENNGTSFASWGYWFSQPNDQ